MKFEVTLRHGAKHIIHAKTLDDAEKKCNKKWKSWQDILMVRK